MKNTQIMEAFRYIVVWALAWPILSLPFFWPDASDQTDKTALIVWYLQLFCWSLLGAVIAYSLAYSQPVRPYIFWPIFWGIAYIITTGDTDTTYMGTSVGGSVQLFLRLLGLIPVCLLTSICAGLLSGHPLFRQPRFSKTP
jgi:hypothetical protein